MNIPNEHDGCNSSGAAPQDSKVPEKVKQGKPERIAPIDFFQSFATDRPRVTHAIVTTGRGGIPNANNCSKPKLKGDRAR